MDDTLDEFGSHIAFHVISAFDWLEAKQISGDDAYNTFAIFFLKNRQLIDTKMKDDILQTAVDISLSFRGENKEERRHRKPENVVIQKTLTRFTI